MAPRVGGRVNIVLARTTRTVLRSGRRLFSGVLVATLGLVAGAGTRAGAILNGVNATNAAAYGDIGSLWATSSSLRCNYYFICSGIFVTPTVFLTAAHCIMQTDAFAAQFSIATPAFHLSTSPAIARCSLAHPCAQPPCSITTPCTDHPRSWVTVTRVYVNHAFHPGSSTSSYAHDEAALTVAAGASGLRGVATFPRDPVVGYLNTLTSRRELTARSTFSFYGLGSRVRQVGVLRAKSLSANFVNESQVGARTGRASGACAGDSGGANLLDPPVVRLFLVALTSTGDAQCNATNVSARLDTASAQKFLASVP